MAEVRRARPADEGPLLGLIREFYSVDRHDYDEQHVATALRPLLEGDALGQVWLLDGPDGPEELFEAQIVGFRWHGFSADSSLSPCPGQSPYLCICMRPMDGWGTRTLDRAPTPSLT